jgi:hypothetical protein
MGWSPGAGGALRLRAGVFGRVNDLGAFALLVPTPDAEATSDSQGECKHNILI